MKVVNQLLDIDIFILTFANKILKEGEEAKKSFLPAPDNKMILTSGAGQEDDSRSGAGQEDDSCFRRRKKEILTSGARSWRMWLREMTVPRSTPDTHRLLLHTTNHLGQHRKWQHYSHKDDTFWKRA